MTKRTVRFFIATGRQLVITLVHEFNETPETVEQELDRIEADLTLQVLAGTIDPMNRYHTYRLVGANEVLRRLADSSGDQP